MPDDIEYLLEKIRESSPAYKRMQLEWFEQDLKDILKEKVKCKN